jgi:hypothetical protein
MPDDRPSARELVETGAEHLAVHVRPALGGHAGFEALVAANLLAIAARELDLGPQLRAAEQRELAELLGREAPLEELEAELAGRIRSGELDDRRTEVLAALRSGARARLRVANPGYAGEA